MTGHFTFDGSLQEIGFADLDVEDEEVASARVEDEEAPSDSQPGAFSALEADGGDAPEPKEESSIFGGKVHVQKPPSASMQPVKPLKR